MVKKSLALGNHDSCKACVGWIDKYFKDCVCDSRGEISFGLGVVSLLSWGIAEIPQIITNFRNKSGSGVSLAFLLTWIVGDVFNLVGCLLEPVTLPTQLYTAVLYTVTTVLLVMQILYYDYWLRWLKSRSNFEDKSTEDGRFSNGRPESHHSQPIPTAPVKTSLSASPDLYYMSARSLASSGTPTFYGRTYLVPASLARSGPSRAAQIDDSSSGDEEENAEGSPTHHRRRRRSSAAKPITTAVSRSAGQGAFLVGSITLPFQTRALMDLQTDHSWSRRFLQEAGAGSSPYGLILGWIMAAIYISGRLPQIYLNIKRGTVEGLNPLMFMFALVANVAYVGSILVRSLEWNMIKSNAPWLLDAIICVLLDIFIIMQFAYYKYLQRRAISYDYENDNETEAKEPLISE